jgi:hypothetical protein
MILNELMSIVGDDSAGADEMRRIPEERKSSEDERP